MSSPTVLAAGSDIKSQFLISHRNRFVFGPIIGDLSDSQNYERYQKAVKRIFRKLGTTPDIIAHDFHPGYFTTQFARTYADRLKSCRPIPVQHHQAHIASVIAEYKIKKDVIGVSFDGTGWGADGNIWGGEFFLCRRKQFERVGHLQYIKMPGGDKCVHEPWRIMLSLLGKKAISFLKVPTRKEKEIVLRMLAKDINTPLTSSCGRLFDAAAALLGICEVASFEAEGPMKLEALVQPANEGSYEFLITERAGIHTIDARPIFLGMIKDIKKGIAQTILATKFHNSFVNIIFEMIKRLSQKTRIQDVVFSGGVFQNNILLTKTVRALQKNKYNVFLNNKIPLNDLNIALGQYYVSRYFGKN